MKRAAVTSGSLRRSGGCAGWMPTEQPFSTEVVVFMFFIHAAMKGQTGTT